MIMDNEIEPKGWCRIFSRISTLPFIVELPDSFLPDTSPPPSTPSITKCFSCLYIDHLEALAALQRAWYLEGGEGLKDMDWVC